MRRWLLYVLTCACVFGIEYLFYTFIHVKLATFYAELIGSPLITVIVMVYVGADATATLETAAARIERIIERAWAIIILDVGITMLTRAAFEAMSVSDAGEALLGILAMFLSATLVYSEPFAALEPDVQTLTIVPFALLRSLMLAWVNVSRVFSLFAIQIALAIAELFLLRAVAPKPGPLFDLIDLGYVAVVTAPLAALFTVAYLDTAAQEQRRLRRS